MARSVLQFLKTEITALSDPPSCVLCDNGACFSAQELQKSLEQHSKKIQNCFSILVNVEWPGRAHGCFKSEIGKFSILIGRIPTVLPKSSFRLLRRQFQCCLHLSSCYTVKSKTCFCQCENQCRYHHGNL